ncbi:Uncharacterised protein [Kluyvera cryocrescens]|uniref:Uncharacterized protein n=1 Tax=Kluyvera cryocrescens TaxID=580 RepID=A0A485AX16_KLUCR|nr:Uncharacterised protein [Kluyvera cryocrescens]
MTVVDHTQFAHFPLMAKLTRWGVDFHMGVLFGFAESAAADRLWGGVVCGDCDGLSSMVD